MAKNKKKIYESWTFWINLVVIVIFGLKGINVPISSNMELTILGVANLILRFKTNKAII